MSDVLKAFLRQIVKTAASILFGVLFGVLIAITLLSGCAGVPLPVQARVGGHDESRPQQQTDVHVHPLVVREVMPPPAVPPQADVLPGEPISDDDVQRLIDGDWELMPIQKRKWTGSGRERPAANPDPASNPDPAADADPIQPRAPSRIDRVPNTSAAASASEVCIPNEAIEIAEQVWLPTTRQPTLALPPLSDVLDRAEQVATNVASDATDKVIDKAADVMVEKGVPLVEWPDVDWSLVDWSNASPVKVGGSIVAVLLTTLAGIYRQHLLTTVLPWLRRQIAALAKRLMRKAKGQPKESTDVAPPKSRPPNSKPATPDWDDLFD